MPSRPTTDKEIHRTLDTLDKERGNAQAAAYKLGISESTLRRYLRLARERGFIPGATLTPEPAGEPGIPDRPQRVSFPPAFASGDLPVYYSRPDNSYVFGACGDSHLGSKYERMDVLNDLYDRFAMAKVDRVFHTGNWVDGFKHGINEHDVHTPHMEGQLRYLAQAYPQRDGIVTYAVAGEDHEGWWARMHGIDIGKRAEQTMREHGRTDWVDLGFMESHVRLVNSNTGAEAIMAVVHPGGGTAYALCFDSETEILTDRGWKMFADLDRTESVATLNRESGEIEFQRPTHYTDEHYHGEMVRFGGDQVDLMVTPNHRMWARRPWDRWNARRSTYPRVNQGYQFVEAGHIKGRDWCIPKSGKWVGKHIDAIPLPPVESLPKGSLKYAFDSLPAKPFLRFLGWFIAEGNVNHHNQQVEISQKPGERQDEITSLCRELGYMPYVWGSKIRVSSKQLYEYLKDTGRSHEKRVPPFVKDLSPELVWEFMEGYLRGDGCKAIRGGEMKWHSATTTSRGLANDLQELLIKVGLSGTVTARPGVFGHAIGNTVVKTAMESHVISINYEFLEPVLTEPLRIPYHGRIYCVSVPNQVILVRRNGKAVFTGNSYQLQKIVESLEGGEKPAVGLYGHYHKLGKFNIRNVWCFLTGCTQDQTIFMRNKVRQETHVGGLIIALEQDPKTGAIVGAGDKMLRYFGKSYGNNRWNKAGSVNLPVRGL